MVPIPDDIRAKVIAELLAGANVSATARKYHLGNETVRRMKIEMSPETLGNIGEQKRRRVDELLVTTVANHFSALDRIAEYVSTPEYLKAKSPEAIATLYEKLANTPLSILEAASAAGLDAAEETEDAAENGDDGTGAS